MSNFFDAVFLSRFSRQDGPHIFKFYPSNFDFINQKNIFTICSFPENQSDSLFQNDQSNIPTTIYSTTIENKNYIYYLFVYTYETTKVKEPTSIAIVSQKMIAPEIFKILLDTRSFLLQLLKGEENNKKEAENIMTNNYSIDCSQNQDDMIYNRDMISERVLDEVWKCIQLCTFNKKTSVLTVFTPLRKFSVVLNNEHVTYSQFDPNFWLSSQTNLYIIWRALMTNRGILIVGDSPAQVSCAVFSIISLAAPLKYCEPYIAYTRLGDPRFAEIISAQSRKWKIVGTTNSLLAEQCKQFAVIGKLSPIDGDKYKEIDPDSLQQKFLNITKSVEHYSHTNHRNSNHRNSNFPLSFKKLDFLNLKNFSNFNSIFSLQLNEDASSDHSQSSFASSTENLSRSMCCNSLRKATKKMMTLIEFRLNSKIEYDPYFDILSKDLLEEDFLGIFIPSSKIKKNQDILKAATKSQQNDNKNNINNNINDLMNQNNPIQNNDDIQISIHEDDDENADDEKLLLSNFDYFDIKYPDSLNMNNNDENDLNYTDEIDVDAIANEFSLPPSTNNQILKPRSKVLIKPKLIFNNYVPSSKASKISSFYLNRNKKKHPKIHFFTTKDAMRLKESLTFKDWRKNITYRSHFRECFLSMMPDEVFVERDKEEQLKIYNSLVDEVSQRYKKDLHMTAVINRHICLVKNLIGLDEK